MMSDIWLGWGACVLKSLNLFEILPGGGGDGGGCMVQIFFCTLWHFFDIQFKNSFNLIC